MNSRILCAVSALVIGALAVPARSAVVVARSDEAMIRMAPAVLTGTIVETYARHDDRGDVETVNRLLVDESIKGGIAAGDIVDVVQFGGHLDGRFQAQSGAPKYAVGERYLVVLDRNGRGQWTTFDLALGQFRFVARDGKELLVRDTHEIAGWMESGEPFHDSDRAAADFVAFARTVVKRLTEPRIAPESLRPAPMALDFDLKATTQTAVNTWHGGASAMNDTVSASAATGDTKVLTDCESRVIPDDPHGDVSGTFNGSGTIATAFFGCGSPCGTCATSVFNSENYTSIEEADIVVNDGVSSSTLSSGNFTSAIVHELGHTFGFRHSNQTPAGAACALPLPCSSNAIMNSLLVNGLNGVLQSWDLDAANEVYGNGTRQASFTGTQYVEVFTFGGGSTSPTRRPGAMAWRIWTNACVNISSATASATPSTITQGATSTLNSNVTGGTTPYTYQWYVGTSGNTSSPVPGGTSASVGVSPSTTTSYWVRVSNSCPSSVDSNTVTVTVNPCVNVGSVTASATPSTISQGSSSTLNSNVVGGSTPYSYQWYIGSVGNTSNPVPGGTTASISVSPSSTTTYWVQVSNSCPSSANSNAVTVTVNGSSCTNVSISSVSATPSTINPGGSSTLSVSAIGTAPLTYQWYVGQKGDLSAPLGSGAVSSLMISPAQTTQYWVLVSNSCPSSAQSNTVTITVNTSGCTSPFISGQPSDQQVISGSRASLALSYGGSSGAVTWYQGTFPDRSTPIGNGTTTSTPVLFSTATFWGEVVNSCGTTHTRDVTVTVAVSCVQPAITSISSSANTVTPGALVTLTAVVTGTQPQFQWYIGQPLDTSNPLPNGTAAIVTDTPTATRTYWLRVTNTCGTADSNAITVVVSTTCPAVAINSVSPDTTISSNTPVSLSVSATGGTLHYQWYNGTTGDTSFLVGDSASFTSTKLFASAQFWVKVTNDCGGSQNSRTINVTVIPAKHRASHH